MVQSISSWAQNIIIAVIITTILEMIIIEGKNKKYIKSILGLYIMFTIISPVIKNFSNKDFKIDVDKILDGEKTYEVSSNNLDLSSDINNMYVSSLESDIKARLIEKGYATEELNLTFNNDKTKINGINLTIKNGKTNKVDVKPIKTIGIQPINKKDDEPAKNDNNTETEEVKEYLSNTYDIDKKQINIILGG